MLSDIRDALRELFAPGTVAELVAIFICLIAPAAILFFAGGERP